MTDLRQLLEDMKLEQVILMGHSMGGRTVMLLSLLDPSRIAKLAVFDSSPIHRTPAAGVKSMELMLKAMMKVDFGLVPTNAKISEAKDVVDAQLDELGLKKKGTSQVYNLT